MLYLYETHLHTSPVSRCAHISAEDSVRLYAARGYAGIFVTNHFQYKTYIPGTEMSPSERMDYFCEDYERACRAGQECGISVFFGAELSFAGTDFLVYGLDKQWYIDHPGLEELKPHLMLELLRESGALVIQAHPFREARYISHIRLFPRNVDGVEIRNASQPAFVNAMAEHYCKSYGLLPFAGSDNHGAERVRFGGMRCGRPIADVADFIGAVKSGEMTPFYRNPEDDSMDL